MRYARAPTVYFVPYSVMAVRNFYGLAPTLTDEEEKPSVNVVGSTPEDPGTTPSKRLTTSETSSSASVTALSSSEKNVKEKKKCLFEPERVYKEFPRQKMSIEFARNCYQSVAIFAFESEEFGKEGQRRYIATTYYEFGKLYLKKKIKHYYEVILEGAACHLYFDIEFKREFNPTVDPILLLDIFIEYVCYQLHAIHHVTCDHSNIMDLDSSTPQKFSRHLIFHMPSTAFRNNILVGHFVREICDQLRRFKHLTECSVEGEKAYKQVYSHSKESKRYPLCPLGERLLQLFVNDEKGGKVLICDEAVYTRNRNFRLYLSTKLGKTAKLRVAKESKFRSSYSESTTRRKWSTRFNTLMDSLVCNVSFQSTQHMRILPSRSKQTTLSQQLNPSTPSPSLPATVSIIGGESTSFSKPIKTEAETGFCHSPFPMVDSFITSILTKGGVQGSIRRWTYFPNGKTVMYDIQHNRWCENIRRPHKSNNIMIIADLKRGTYYQKCHDPECRRINFRSNEIPIPLECNPVLLQQEEGRRKASSKEQESEEAMFYIGANVSLEDFEQFDDTSSSECLELEEDKGQADRERFGWDVSLGDSEHFDETISNENFQENRRQFSSETESDDDHIGQDVSLEDIEQFNDAVPTNELYPEERIQASSKEKSAEAEFYIENISHQNMVEFEETSSHRKISVRKRKRSLPEAEDSLDVILREALEDYESCLSPVKD